MQPKGHLFIFSLKYPFLLAFEARQSEDTNLKTIYNTDDIPCDTQKRTILDNMEPAKIELIFNDVYIFIPFS